MKLTQVPIFRMYHLVTDKSQRNTFVEAGVHNLLTSHQNEPGTLAMYATHLDESGTDNYVFELYQNEAKYQIHADSSQFKAYGQVAKKVVRSKNHQELRPQYLQTNQQDLVVSGENDYSLKLTTFDLIEEDTDTFKQKIAAMMKKQDITYYLATLNEAKTCWLSLELVRGTGNEEISKLVESSARTLQTKILAVDTLVSQADIIYHAFK